MNQDPHVTDDLSAYLANELELSDRGTVELHLRECEACRNELDVQKRLDELLAGTQALSPGPELIHGVMQRVSQEPKSIVFRKHVLPWLAAAAVLAAVLLLLRIQKDTALPGEVVQGKKPVAIKQEKPPAPQPEASQTVIPPDSRIPKSKQPQVAPAPPIVPQQTPPPSITPEEAEVIAQLDELENMELISNYENLENLEIALIGEGGESLR